MFDWFRKKKNEAQPPAPEAPAEAATEAAKAEPEAAAPPEAGPALKQPGLFSRFKEKLSATRSRLSGRLETLLASVRTIDDNLLDELEELLITADLGVATTTDLLFKIRGQVAKKELSDARALKETLKKRIREMVDLPRPPRPEVKPLVILVVGINGVGKTTTIAKLARRLKEDEGQKVLLAAGDTFRSAAVEQLTIWAERLGVDIVSQPTGADASAVVFDALTAARARGSDVVIIDTAGRLHTQINLMDELKKIQRVAGKAMPGAPHHTILVLDGHTGQNALRQAQTFKEAVGVDSIIVTKLDGTAKGGVIVSIAHELKIPIVFVGLGETFEDLQPFDPQAFTEAILEP
ncbi:MAG: signal recognition particle-docking protein FtsY [Candidatus Adiutrix sp.]|jgi:fused signal recognition particle receptor|nr:signal recognition particle-docking protein FtsY [Candidatus Adiutrix sp.]